MFFNKKLAILVVLIMVAPIVLTACGGTPEPEIIIQTVPVEVTKIIEKEGEKVTVVETQIVEVEVPVEVEVTAVPEEQPAAGELAAPDPETYTFVSFGDPDTLDINLNYETSGGQVILNVAEGLIFYDFNDSTTFVPQLATEVPSLENGGISEDGLTYTFNIREGVTFHNGADLTPSDCEYTFQRGLRVRRRPGGAQGQRYTGGARGGVREGQGGRGGRRRSRHADLQPGAAVGTVPGHPGAGLGLCHG
jgi:peptide/nickel transport system substrate-binding protein